MSILRWPPLPPVISRTELTHTVGGRASLGDKSLVLSVTLFVFAFAYEQGFALFTASALYGVMYAKKPLCLHEGTHLHIQKCSPL